VKVDHVRPQPQRPERWRICPPCSFACRGTDDDFGRKECPRCGHSGYADSGPGQGEMPASVSARPTTEDCAAVRDDSDERNSLSSFTELLILPRPSPGGKLLLRLRTRTFPFGAV